MPLHKHFDSPSFFGSNWYQYVEHALITFQPIIQQREYGLLSTYWDRSHKQPSTTMGRHLTLDYHLHSMVAYLELHALCYEATMLLEVESTWTLGLR